MRAEQKRAMLWTIGASLLTLAFFIILAPERSRDILGFIIVANLIGLIFSLLRIRGEETSNEKFVRKWEEDGPPGFWKGTLLESGRAFSYLFGGIMILALILYVMDGTNLLQMFLAQSLETVGLLTFVLVITSFLLGAVFHANSEERYEKLKQKLEHQ